MSKIDKITRVLVQPNKHLVLKIHCKTTKIVNGVKQDFNNIFDYGENTYLKMDHLTFLTLEINDDGPWGKSKNLVITSRNLYQVQQALKTMINTLRSGEVYKARKKVNSDGSSYMELFIYTEDVKNNSMVIRLLGDSNNRLGLQPCIITDECECQHEGVRILINKQSNAVEVTLEELEALYYNIAKVDLFMYGQTMVNYYMTHIKDKSVEVKTYGKPNNETKVSFNVPSTENVTSTLINEKSEEEVFMIKK